MNEQTNKWNEWWTTNQTQTNKKKKKKITNKQTKTNRTSKGSVHVMLLILPFTLIHPLLLFNKTCFLALALQHVIPYRTGEQLIETSMASNFVSFHLRWNSMGCTLLMDSPYCVCGSFWCRNLQWMCFSQCLFNYLVLFFQQLSLSFLLHLFNSQYFSVQVSSRLVPVRFTIRWEWSHNQEFKRNSSFEWKLYDPLFLQTVFFHLSTLPVRHPLLDE